MSRIPPIFADGRARRIACVVLMAVGQGVAAAVIVFATRDAFAALRATEAHLPTGALLAIAVGGFLLAACRLSERVLAEAVGQNYAAAVRERLFLHMSRRPVGQVSEQRLGAMSLRFVGDLGAVRGWIASGLTRLMSSSITIVASLIILFSLNPTIGMAALPVLVTALLILSLLGRNLAPVHEELRKRRSRLAADMTERLPQATALRRFGRLKQERRHLNRHSEQVAKAAVRRAFSTGLLQIIPDIAAASATVLVLAVAWSAQLSVADTVAALTAMALTVRPMRQLAGVWDRRQAWLVAHGKLERALTTKRLPRGNSAKADTTTAPSSIVDIKDVKLLTDVRLSASLDRGAWTRLDGPKGSGKSTLLLMIAGLEVPSKGKVFVDGKPPFAVHASDVVYVGPFSPILKGTLRRNLTIGTSQQTDDNALSDLFALFNMRGLLDRLGGLDGDIAEGGANLSRVEIARVLAVRALAVQPQLLLADADEIGLGHAELSILSERLKPLNCSALIATSAEFSPDLFDQCLNIPSPKSTGAQQSDLRPVITSKGAL